METGIIEAPIAPERENTSPSPEFSRRLLLAPTNKDALNPALPLGPSTRESLGTLTERNYTIFNTHSNQERTAYWSTKPEQTKEAQMEAWLTGTQATFANGREFFTNSAQGKQWAEVYKKLGLSADNIQRDSLKQFYTKYLGNADAVNGGVKQFVTDVLASPAYRTADGKFDSTKLEKDIPAITWLANVFGEKSSQIVSSLTAAEGIVQDNPDALVTNTDTTLSTQESELLGSLNHAVPTPPVEQPVPEPQTTTTATTPATEQNPPVTQTPAESTPPAQVTHSTPATESVTQPTTPQPAETHTPTQQTATTPAITEPTPERNPATTTPPVTTLTPAEAQPAAPQAREIDPTKNLATQVNETLRSAATTNMRFEVPPAALTNYLKILKFDGGDMKKFDAQIVNGKMILKGEVGIHFGSIDFNATLVNGSDGKLIIEGVPIIKYHGSANLGGVKEKAQKAIGNLSNKMTEMIRSQADPAWDVASTQIVGDKLALEFKKK